MGGKETGDILSHHAVALGSEKEARLNGRIAVPAVPIPAIGRTSQVLVRPILPTS